MTLTRRHFNRFLLAALGTAALPAWAAELVEGRDWRPVPTPQPGDTPGKIEVIEFFSYACPHCADLNPLITPWAAALPADVAFRRVPVTFGRMAWTDLARLYLALEYTGDLERLNQAVFDALHKEKLRLFSKQAILDWLATQGVDRESFATVLSSFGIETRLARSEKLAKDYQINAVPMLTVAGRYVVVGKESPGLGDHLVIADGLIAKARAEAAKG